MSPKTATLPPTEPAMWRKLLAKVHPDADGDHELFIWTSHVRELVCEGSVAATSTGAEPRSGGPKTSRPDAVPFNPHADFADLTRRARDLAYEVPALYGELLALLHDCEEAYDGPQVGQQRRGATYKQLAAIGHGAGMTKEQRTRWYRIAESVPLSVRHAVHILSRQKG